MSAPAANNDGMGSLLYADGACRFRVWAPFAQRVQVTGGFTPNGPIDLAAEGSTGNWSADRIRQRGRHVPVSDHQRERLAANRRARTAGSKFQRSLRRICRRRVPADRQPFQTPAFENFLIYQLHVGSYCGRNDRNRGAGEHRHVLDTDRQAGYIRGLGFTRSLSSHHRRLLRCRRSGRRLRSDSDMFASEDEYRVKPRCCRCRTDPADRQRTRNRAGRNPRRCLQPRRGYRQPLLADDGNARAAAGIYFVDGHDTRFGSGFAMWQQEVKDYFLDNGRMTCATTGWTGCGSMQCSLFSRTRLNLS